MIKPIRILATMGGTTIKVNQAIMIYDTTVFKYGSDSTSIYPNHVYKWTISPTDDSAVFSQNYQFGYAEIIFNHPNTYKISAQIYDSLGQRLISHTDTVSVTVTADSLHQYQAVYPDDTLLITMGAYAPGSQSVDLNMSTSKSYLLGTWAPSPVSGQATVFPIATSDISFGICFSDSVALATYPFAYNYGGYGPVTTTFLLGEFFVGVPAPFSITWLNKTYTGTITLNSSNQFTYTWDNPGAVKFTN
jgi:hypothetical protein